MVTTTTTTTTINDLRAEEDRLWHAYGIRPGMALARKIKAVERKIEELEAA